MAFGDNDDVYDDFDDRDFDDEYDDIDDLLAAEDEENDRYYDDELEHDGQPSEYEEWQDFYGGDDWDHGQFDDFGGEG